MFQLRGNKSEVSIAEDLSLLRFQVGNLSRETAAPFRFRWSDRVIDLGKLAAHRARVEDGAIVIDFFDFHFAARFPGNSYCRPDPAYTPPFRLTVTLRLEADELQVESSSIDSLDGCKVKLSCGQDFFRFSSQDVGTLVLPLSYGARFDFPRNDYERRTFEPSGNWPLPVHGRFDEKGGIGLWCDDLDREYELRINADQAGTTDVECLWCFDDMANTPRKMHFKLFPPGSDFRDLARWCRRRRQASGRFRTLAEKIAADPEVGKLPGTVFWKHSVYYHKRPAGIEKGWSLYVARPDWNENEGLPGNWTAAEIFETAAAAGFDRVCVCNTGWNRDGFDAGYPARLPIDPERGTLEELKECIAAAKKISDGYILSVHDNYIDAYRGDAYCEEEMLQQVAGVPFRAGIWRGGQAHFLCSRCGLEYARRDLPQIADLFGRGAIYLDVNASTPLFPCRAEAHPLTRAGDRENRRAMYALAKSLFGALAVEGCGTDEFADLIDIGAYGTLHYTPQTPAGEGAVAIPLWQMVYHDSVLNYFGEGYARVHGSEYRLYQALFALLPTGFDEHGHQLSHRLRTAYTAPMTDFVELRPLRVRQAADGSFETDGAAVSRFGDGTEVAANFSMQPVSYRKTAIPPREYRIFRVSGKE